MPRKFHSVSLLLTFLVGSPALAHGENKPGPHGGHVRMPGAFHTEVVPGDEKFKVFLLDISFETPTAVNSTVHAQLKKADDTFVDATCSAETDFFVCKLPQGLTLQNGMLEIKASRLGAPSVPVEYKLPLTFAGTAH